MIDYVAEGYKYIRPNTFCDVGFISRLYPKVEHILLTNSGMQAISFLMFWGKMNGFSVYHEKSSYIETRFLSPNKEIDLKSGDAEIPMNSMIFIDNPDYRGEWFDISKLSKRIHAAKSLLVVDNSRVSIYYDHALEQGADFVVESYTKYAFGNGTKIMGGVYCNFLSNPEWSELVLLAANFGVAVAGSMADMLKEGLKTLPLRMERITDTATQISHYLRDKAQIATQYCGAGGLINIPETCMPAVCQLADWEPKATFGLANSTWTNCSNNGYLLRTGANVKEETYIRLSVGLEKADKLLIGIRKAFAK